MSSGHISPPKGLSRTGTAMSPFFPSCCSQSRSFNMKSQSLSQKGHRVAYNPCHVTPQKLAYHKAQQAKITSFTQREMQLQQTTLKIPSSISESPKRGGKADTQVSEVSRNGCPVLAWKTALDQIPNIFFPNQEVKQFKNAFTTFW